VNATWHLETDASINPTKVKDGRAAAGGGIVLRDPEMKVKIVQSIDLGYTPSATHAEYAALIRGLEIALDLGVPGIFVRTDNRAVAEHFRGTWKAKSAGIPELLAQVRELAQRFAHSSSSGPPHRTG
jgi:ribonuclease HI